MKESNQKLSKISIVLPCYNEEKNLPPVIKKLIDLYPDAEIIVVDDNSSDNSAKIARELGVISIQHPTNMGNGASIKTGARKATGDIIVFMDSDGQHKPEDIAKLLNKIDQGYDMAIGARPASSHASSHRLIANSFYNKLASYMTGYKIEDLTSGFRAVKAKNFRRFLYLLPNGFSYPTTSTMAFLRSGYPIAFVTISMPRRQGKSHMRIFKDGTRFFIIILKVGALFSPMRFFLPISFFAFSSALAYYAYTYFSSGRFTNMSALLFMTSILTFLIGIVSEQVSALHYRDIDAIERKDE
jgi:glycosyltransferase involved in cell wall biosynthesis